MKAIVQQRYGAPSDVLRLTEVGVPDVGAEDVLVRVRASSANPWDWHFIRGEPVLMRPAGIGGVRRPTFLIPGGDLAGTVDRVGDHVTGFAPGADVYGFGHGAFAEYVAVPQNRLAPMPAGLSFEQAASVPLAAVTALQCLRAGGIAAGQRVLVVGASGGVGTFAVQLAKHLGAHVTGVCSTPHVDLVQGLGADQVIDYTREDFTAGTGRYDLVLQLGGTYSATAIRRILTPCGTLIQSYGDGGRWLGPLAAMAKAALLNPFTKQTLKGFTATVTSDALAEITDLIESGHVVPVIGRTFPLAQAAAAVDLVEKGSPPGKVVVLLD